MKALLIAAQNLKPGDEHPLPWYPPVCVPLLEIPEFNRRTYDHLKSMAYSEKSKIPLKYNDPSMRPVCKITLNYEVTVLITGFYISSIGKLAWDTPGTLHLLPAELFTVSY